MEPAFIVDVRALIALGREVPIEDKVNALRNMALNLLGDYREIALDRTYHKLTVGVIKKIFELDDLLEEHESPRQYDDDDYHYNYTAQGTRFDQLWPEEERLPVMAELGKLLSKVISLHVDEFMIPDLANIVGEYTTGRYDYSQ